MKRMKLVGLALIATAALAALAPAQDVTPPTVTDIRADGVLLPDAVLDFAPSEIVVTFSEDIDPATVSTDTFRLVASGGDGTFDDGNEVEIVPDSVTLSPANVATMALASVSLEDDAYRVTLGGGDGPTTGLVGHWKFDETSGTTAYDSSGNANDGALVNGPVWQPTGGKRGGALAFDGSNDYVDCGNGSSLNFVAAATISAWAKLDAIQSGNRAVVEKDEQWRLAVVPANSEVMNLVRTDGIDGWTGLNNESFSFATGVWYHLAFTWDGSVLRHHVDGQQIGSDKVATGSIVVGASNARMGYLAYDSNYFDGLIDDVRIYDRALSAAEIAVLARGAVADLAGNVLDGDGNGTPGPDYECAFTVEAAVPSVVSTTPGDTEAGVEVTTDVTVTFSERMNETDTALAFSISPVVAGAAVCIGSVLTFTPDADLASETLYTVTIDTGAKDLAGKPIAADYVFAFTTRDAIPPTVTDIQADGVFLPGASFDFAPSQIVVTFSEDIDPATVSTDTIRLVRSGGDGTFGDGNEVEVTPVSITLSPADAVTVDLAGVSATSDTYGFQICGVAAPSTGLVGHWTFDDGSGMTAADSSGNGNHGTLVNMDPAADWVAGKHGGALDFDGNLDYVETNATSFDLGIASDAPRTVCVWARCRQFNDGCIFAVGQFATRRKFSLRTRSPGSNGWRADFWDDWLDFNYPSTDVWVHLALVYDGSEVVAYANGIQVAAKTVALDTASSGTFKIGSSGTVIGFDGLVDDVWLFDRVLTQAEIQTVASCAPLAGVADLAGNLLDGEYTTSLPSGDGTVGGDFVCTFEITAPTVLATSPAADAVNVPVTATIEATFSRAMNETATADAFFVSGGVTGPKSWAGNTLILTPDQPLEYSHYYTVTITTGAKDASGVPLADTYTFAFTTVAEDVEDGTTPFDGGCGGGGALSAFLAPLALLCLAIGRRRGRR